MTADPAPAPTTKDLAPPLRHWRLDAAGRCFLVAPYSRQADARGQFAPPAFQRVMDPNLRFLASSDLVEHRESMARFGHGLRPLDALARPLRVAR